MRIRIVVFALVIFAVMLSGCTEKAPEGGDVDVNDSSVDAVGGAALAGDEINIGALQSLTGDLGTYGGPMTDAIKLAVDEINGNGGVLGRPINLIAEDDQTSEIGAVDAANKLVKIDRVPAIIGCTGSGPSMSIIDIVTGSGVLQISSSNTGIEFTNYRDDDLYFRTASSDALQGAAMAKLAFENGHRTAATFVINNPYGVGFEEVFVNAFEDLGGDVVQTVRYDPAQTVFGSEVDKAVSSAPDVVILVSYPETGSLILRTAYEKGAFKDTTWLLSEGLATDNMADLVGKSRTGGYVIAGFQGLTPDPSAGGAAYEAFSQKYIAEYGREPGIYTSGSYDAMALVALAMEQAGEASGRTIAANMRSVANPPGEEVSDIGTALQMVRDGKEINYQGASGQITFDENGDVSGAYIIWTVGDDGNISMGERIEV